MGLQRRLIYSENREFKQGRLKRQIQRQETVGINDSDMIGRTRKTNRVARVWHALKLNLESAKP